MHEALIITLEPTKRGIELKIELHGGQVELDDGIHDLLFGRERMKIL